MKCPVCKTECNNSLYCPECGFDELQPIFINKGDADNWVETRIKPYRKQYWRNLNQFEIKNETIVKYLGKEKHINIPYGIVAIGKNAFQMSPAESISFPNTVKYIEEGAFSWCLSLSGKVLLPDSLEYLGRDAFKNCHSVKTISLPSSVQKIEHHALQNSKYWQATIVFSGEPSNYCIEEGFLIHRRTDTLIEYLGQPNSSTTPEKFDSHDLLSALSCVSHIGSYAFSGYGNMIQGLILPNCIRVVDDVAFFGCLNLEWVILQKGIAYMGRNVFTFCKKELRIFCEAESLPEAWNKDCFLDEFTQESIQIFWGGTWHYENGKTVPKE